MAVPIAPAAAGAGTIPAPPWKRRAAFASVDNIIGTATRAHPVGYDTRTGQDEVAAPRRYRTDQQSRRTSRRSDHHRPWGPWEGSQTRPTSALNSTRQQRSPKTSPQTSREASSKSKPVSPARQPSRKSSGKYFRPRRRFRKVETPSGEVVVIKYRRTGPQLPREATTKVPSTIAGRRSRSQRSRPHTRVPDPPTESTDPGQIERSDVADAESRGDVGGVQLRAEARLFEPEACGNLNYAANACQEESTKEEKGGQLRAEARPVPPPACSKHTATATKTPGPIESSEKETDQKLRAKARPFTPAKVGESRAASQVMKSSTENSGTRLRKETRPCSTHGLVRQLMPPSVVTSRATARSSLARPRTDNQCVRFADTLVTDTWTFENAQGHEAHALLLQGPIRALGKGEEDLSQFHLLPTRIQTPGP